LVGKERETDLIVLSYVGPFVARNQRATGSGNFTNIYLKQMNPALTQERFSELVSKATSDIAKVTSPWLATRAKEDGSGEESKGFGFVNFETHEGAVRALERFQDMNKLREVAPELLNPKEDLYAAQAIPKNKRKRQIAQIPLNRNLYIKNIAESVTDEQFYDLFKGFGEITSAKIMANEETGVKRGFGFVCYKNPEHARAAITKMNNFLLENKPLYVGLAQPKEARRKQLESQFNNNRIMAMYGSNPNYPGGPQRAMMRPMGPPRVPPYAHPMVQRYMVPHMNPPTAGMDSENQSLSLREMVKRTSDDNAKIQLVGDHLFNQIFAVEKDDHASRRIVGSLLSSAHHSTKSVEEQVNKLLSLCEDPEKRAEEIQALKKNSTQPQQ